jgi:hypothetical protein
MIRPPPPVASALAAALSRALRHGATGTLEVSTRGERHRIHLRVGYVVQVDLDGGQEPLGLVLVEHGLLSLGELRLSLRRRRDDLYGVSLIRDSVLSADSVVRGLQLQLARRTARLYGLDEARFAFHPGAIPTSALASPGARLHPIELLCLAARHPANAHRSLSRVLCQLKSQWIRLSVLAADLRRFPALRDHLSAAEWNAVELLGVGCRLSDFFSAGLLPAAAASALVEALYLCDALEVGARDEARRPPRAGAQDSEPIAEIRREVRRGSEPHRLLGVAPGSPPSALRAAYRRRALLLHPDRWTQGAPRDLPELFAAVAQAYRSLIARDTEPPRAASG